MYSPDTLNRLNAEAVERYEAEAEEVAERIANGEPADEIDDGTLCDCCSEPATHALPVYNPADAVREPPVEGAYAIVHACDDCYESGNYMEELFTCECCGELFIINHSWDVVAVIDSDGIFCQKCYAEEVLAPMTLSELERQLLEGDVRDWKRLNDIPGKSLLVEVEFSEWGDFPGATRLEQVWDEIRIAAEEAGLGPEKEVYPAITHGFQFSVCLGVFH